MIIDASNGKLYVELENGDLRELCKKPYSGEIKTYDEFKMYYANTSEEYKMFEFYDDYVNRHKLISEKQDLINYLIDKRNGSYGDLKIYLIEILNKLIGDKHE